MFFVLNHNNHTKEHHVHISFNHILGTKSSFKLWLDLGISSKNPVNRWLSSIAVSCCPAYSWLSPQLSWMPKLWQSFQVLKLYLSTQKQHHKIIKWYEINVENADRIEKESIPLQMLQFKHQMCATPLDKKSEFGHFSTFERSCIYTCVYYTNNTK